MQSSGYGILIDDSRQGGVNAMLLGIIDDKRKLIPALLILYILSWELSVRVIFP